MNKLFIMAAAVGVALTACTSEKEEGLSVNNQKAITFASPVVSPSTRTLPDGTIAYPTTATFGVYACWTSGAFATWNDESVYMNNVEVLYDSSIENPKGAFAPAKDYYWPKEGKLTFAAYSPFGVENVTYGTNGLKVANFTVPANGYTKGTDTYLKSSTNQYALMYADRVFDQVASTGTGEPYAGVDINFKHALSAVNFTVKTKAAYANTTIKLKKISINNIKNAGTFEENITSETAAGAPKWTSPTGTAEYVVYDQTAGIPNTVTNTAQNVIDLTAGKALIVLPQTITSSSTFTIVWSMKGSGVNDKEIEQTSTVDLSTIQFANDGGAEAKTAEWRMGKRYTYNIIIGLNKIYFNPTCTDWVDVTGADISIE